MKDQQIRRLLENGRRGRNQGGSVDAHRDESGIAIPRSGDAQAPFTKLSPFVTEAEQYWQEQELPDAAMSYIDGPIIDVSQWRTLIIYVVCGGQLSLIPQAAPDLDVDTDMLDAFTNPDRTPLLPIGAIDPTMTPVTVPSTSAAFASRTMYGTEIRNPADTECRLTLSFDVTMYSAFNFRAAEVEPGEGPETVSLTYALSM